MSFSLIVYSRRGPRCWKFCRYASLACTRSRTVTQESTWNILVLLVYRCLYLCVSLWILDAAQCRMLEWMTSWCPVQLYFFVAPWLWNDYDRQFYFELFTRIQLQLNTLITHLAIWKCLTKTPSLYLKEIIWRANWSTLFFWQTHDVISFQCEVTQ